MGGVRGSDKAEDPGAAAARTEGQPGDDARLTSLYTCIASHPHSPPPTPIHSALFVCISRQYCLGWNI